MDEFVDVLVELVRRTRRALWDPRANDFNDRTRDRWFDIVDAVLGDRNDAGIATDRLNADLLSECCTFMLILTVI